jgi:membrane fusion protein (multidrug efflux system)
MNAAPASRRRWRLLLLVAVPLAAAAGGLHLYATGGRFVETDNAYVKAHIVAVSSEVAGRVTEVAVRDNQPVAAGDVLFRVDRAPLEVTIRRAEAQMAVVRTDLESLRAELRLARAEEAEAEERIRFYARQLERQQQLRERGMGREDVHDEARHNLDVARRKREGLRERAARVIASLGGEAGLPAERHPRYREANAVREAAALELARTAVRAPAAGVVSNMRLQPGEHVQKGVAVFSLIEAREHWVEANFKETQLARVRVGQRARVVADAYPGREWHARVTTIAPATGAEFAVLPPQNASGNWVKVVQRVPVHLAIEPAPGAPALRAGMTVTVSVDTGQSRGWSSLLER